MRKLEKKKTIFFTQIFIIFIFFLSILVAVNLSKTSKEARNLVRGMHMESIENATYTYYITYRKFPDCIPKSGKAIDVTRCKELQLFLTSFPKDPSPGQKYFIEYLNKKKENIRIFSSAPEAKKVEIIH